MLSTDQTCSECGAPMQGSAGLGWCNACALRGAIALPQMGGARAPGLDSIASKKFGDYELLDEIARGGMGVVYRARQRSLGRIVALKVLLGGAFTGVEGRHRLQSEAAAAARLQHPNIVAVHEIGELDAQPFYSMEFVEGRTLAGVVRAGPLPAVRAANYLVKIARGVQHAHEQGILHRDLKPSNVLIDVRDEPRITDFGLARQLDAEVSGTLTGTVMGSPAYMPPEQAAGRNRELSAASDVYALGAMLYEMLTGRPPFFAESPQAIIEQVKTDEPVTPRQLNASVPADLENICLKCLEKEATRRYQTAKALAEDLERFLRGEPVQARPVSPAGRLTRWCRRHPALASVWVLVVLLAVGSTLASIWIARARDSALAANQKSNQSLWEARLAQARAVITTKQPGQRLEALAAIKEAAGINPSPELRDVAIAALTRMDVTLVKEWEARKIQGNVWKFHPSMRSYVVETVPGLLEWRERDSDRVLAQLNAKDMGKLASVPRFSRDGSLVAFSSTNQAVQVWSLDPPMKLVSVGGASDFNEFSAMSFPQPVDFSAEGKSVAICPGNGGVVIHRIGGDKELQRSKDTTRFDQVRYSPDGLWLAVSSESSNILEVLDAHTLGIRWQTNFPANTGALAWRSDGRELAIGIMTGTIYFLAAEDGSVQRELRGHTLTPDALVFSNDGHLLWSRGSDSTMRAWDVATGEEQLVRVDTTPDQDLTLSADSSEMIFSKDWSQAVEARADLPKLVSRLPSAGSPARAALVGSIAFSPDSQWLAFTTFSGATVVNVPRRMIAAWLPALSGPGHRGNEPTVRFTPDGKGLFYCQRDAGLIRVPLNPQLDGTCLTGAPATLDGEKEFLLSDMSTDGRWLALTQRTPGTLKIIDSATGVTVKRIEGQPELLDARFSSDRLFMVTETTGLDLPSETDPKLWSVNDWKVVREFPVGPLGLLSFSGDGKYFACGGQLGFKLYTTSDWAEVKGLPEVVSRTSGDVPSLSRDGKMLAVGVDARVHLIDPATGRQFAILPALGNNGQAARPCLSPDGRTLAVLCDDGTLDLWDLVELRHELAGLGLDWEDSVPNTGKKL
jgi:eukaryotic-like serine/threonine-protein kinase